MYEQTRSIFTDEYRGVPICVIEDSKKYNKAWGTEYIACVDKVPDKDEIEGLAEGFVFLRALGGL